MANPTFIDCLEEVWIKVATNVTTGLIHKVDLSPYGYLQTYRDTGGAAPTLKSEGVPAFEKSRTEEISSVNNIDVYLYSLKDRGRVRVDL